MGRRFDAKEAVNYNATSLCIAFLMRRIFKN
jgi:hypothetical protein